MSLLEIDRSELATPGDLAAADLERLVEHANGMRSKAMELTDSWGQAMFVLQPELVHTIFSALGFNEDVASGVYYTVRSLEYVKREQVGAGAGPECTWHALDAACLTLRGVRDLDTALDSIDDTSVESLLQSNQRLFDALMRAMPDYASALMFSPEVAATVVASLGGRVSAEKIYELAATYGRQRTMDIDGRRGVSTQFIRSMTLTLSAAVA